MDGFPFAVHGQFGAWTNPGGNVESQRFASAECRICLWELATKRDDPLFALKIEMWEDMTRKWISIRINPIVIYGKLQSQETFYNWGLLLMLLKGL